MSHPGIIESYVDMVQTTEDPEVDSWPFMSSPAPVFCTLAVYLYFIFKIGPRWMEGKKPYNLSTLLVFYNAVQIIYNLLLVYYGTKTKVNVIREVGCRPPVGVKAYQHDLAVVSWWYFFSKVVDLFDTVFFVMRKKHSQITFLHVYHHTSTVVFSWAYLKYLPGEQGLVIGVLNSMVHVFMYTYYLISALGPDYAKYLWWKKYMTTIQLIQFCLMMSYMFTLLVLDCNLPKSVSIFFFANALVFLFMFSGFYRKTYKQTKSN